MDQGLSETLETLQRQIDNLRDDLHGRIDRLEESVSLLDKVAARKPSVEAALAAQLSSIMKAEKRIEALDHAHDTAARLRDAPEKRINARLDEIEALMEDHSVSIHGLSEDVEALEARLSSKPDDFGGVTSTGSPKTMTRWVIVSALGNIFSEYSGLVDRKDGAKFRGKAPKFFRNKDDADKVRQILFAPHYSLEEVEVIERDGRLIEARYA